MMSRSLWLVGCVARATGLAVVTVMWAAGPGEALDAARALGRATPAVSVDDQRARVSVGVQDQPQAEVVAELIRQTGIPIHIYAEDQGLLTASFRDVPLDQALRRLFGPDAQYAFRYELALPSAVPVEAWVWTAASRSSSGPALSSAAPAVDGDAFARRLEIRRVADEQGSVSVQTLIAALRDGDASVRRDAAAGLVRRRDDSVVEELGALLMREPEPELRATAAEILATIASPPALIVLRQALDDPEYLVRARAVAALVNFAGRPGLASLRHAARDRSDEAQQALATLADDGSDSGRLGQ
jgi:hypothetical protein